MSRRVGLIIVIVLVFLFASAGTFGFLMWKHKNDAEASPVLFAVNTQGWDKDSSSPIPIHITGQTTQNDTVDKQYFIGGSNNDLMLQPGEYTAEVYASPVNENGGMYDAPEPTKIVVPEKTNKPEKTAEPEKPTEPEKTGEPETQDSPDTSNSDAPVVTVEITLVPASPLTLTEEDREKAFKAMKDAGLSDEQIEQFTVAVDKILNSPAAKLSDDELLNLLAYAPLSAPDKEFVGGNTTHYRDSIAFDKKCDEYGNCFDMWLSGSGTISQEKACGQEPSWGFNTEFGKPLIADINNDGIRDILSLSYGATCTPTEWGRFSNIYTLTAYTPNAEGTALELMAYNGPVWSDDIQAQCENLVTSEGKKEQTQWIFREHYQQQVDKSILSTEPILSFEDGHIRAKMARGHFYETGVMGYDIYHFNELYTVTFEIQDNKLVPVEAKRE